MTEEQKIAQPNTTAETVNVAKKKEEKVQTKAEAEKTRKQKKSKKRHVVKGNVYIESTYNNTIVSFTDQQGNVLVQSSAGRCGFKGPKKSTPYAAGIIVKDAAERVREFGLKDVAVLVKGIGVGREGAIRAINAQGFNMLSIRDITPMPHNGCRPKK
ncbi:MAG TPA: 30S ribosomal protein S11, partial [Patescibacteria group bacterium]|nr:30S ribosomal protein S11 [Patescibacteria group bacterium]